MPLTALNPRNPRQAFPDPAQALEYPNGLLAIGGCLSPPRLINAYKIGVFPWYNPGEPILWWSPHPRLVLFPENLHLSRSLNKSLRKTTLRISYDRDFASVVDACAAPRARQNGTWLSSEMKQAYQQLHYQGYAHSFEAWNGDELQAGLYGVALGRVFFGESMFHRRTDASKIVFAHFTAQLRQWRYRMIDCQVSTPHLLSLGAEELPRDRFQTLLAEWTEQTPDPEAWRPC